MESEPGGMGGVVRRVLMGALALNIADAILHIAVGQAEAQRIASNIVLIVIAVVFLARPAWARATVCLVAAGFYLALNLWSIAERGIGGLGILFIAVSTLLMILAAVLLRRVRWQRPVTGRV